MDQLKYAQNLHAPVLATEVQEWMSTPEFGRNMERWLLFDGAVLGEKATKRLLRMIPTSRVQNIFFGTSRQSYGVLSPQLVRITSGSTGNWLSGVIDCMDGFPAVSLLNVHADRKILGQCLSWLGNASTGDGLDLYCRFADTRVTPSLMSVLYQEQVNTLRRCIHEWRVVDRLGQLRPVLNDSVRGQFADEAQRSSGYEQQLRLSDAQFSMMMKTAETDEIFQMLCDGASDLVPHENRGNFHVRLSRLVTAGYGQGLKSTKDIYLFCVIALATSDEFYRTPELTECWSRLRAGLADFSSLVANWPDEIWNALARTDTCAG